MGEPTYDQIIDEARIRRHAAGYGLGANFGSPPLGHFIIEVVREGWTPPEPVDPDVIAVRGVLALMCNSESQHNGYRDGKFDHDTSFQMSLATYKAGKEDQTKALEAQIAALEESVARLSGERQPLLEACQTLATLLDTDDWIATGRLAVKQAQAAIAKVRGEAAGS
jgi:hypothetical protein